MVWNGSVNLDFLSEFVENRNLGIFFLKGGGNLVFDVI